MPKPSKNPTMKCMVCGRKFVSQEKFGAHVIKHVEECLPNPVEEWLNEQLESITEEQFSEASEKLFGSDLGCRAVFLALCAIDQLAEENDDKTMADACQLVMRGLALGRKCYLESP